MREKKLINLTIQQLLFIIYFILTTVIFFISLNLGNDGVSIKLFGGGDDGNFYWAQAKNIVHNQPAVLTSIYPLIIGYLIKITGIENVYIIRLFNYCGFVLLTLLSIKLIEVIIKLENKEKELSNDYYCRFFMGEKKTIISGAKIYITSFLHMDRSNCGFK